MTDRATAYAEQVRAGTVVVGRLQRQACLRHLRDQQLAAERGWEWRSPDAEEAIDFFDQVLCLPEEADADEEPDEEAPPDGQPFVLTPWQQFVVGSLMGWYTVRNGRARRRFRTAYIETAKGSGKTPLCAGLLIYLAVTGDRGSQIFAAAATKDQAKVAFADCEKMVAASPYLRDLFVGTVNNLAIPSKESFIRAISSEKRGLDGKRVSAAVLDELHEHPTATVVNKIRKGIKGRKNALILEPASIGRRSAGRTTNTLARCSTARLRPRTGSRSSAGWTRATTAWRVGAGSLMMTAPSVMTGRRRGRTG
jgi:phage terminase large subunit-like protein